MSRLQPLHRVYCWTPDAGMPPASLPSAHPTFAPDTPLCLDRARGHGAPLLTRGDFAIAGRQVHDWILGHPARCARTDDARVSGAAATRVLIYLDDPFDFLCALFGTLAAGCVPVLPAHDAPAYWDALSAADAYDLTLTAEAYVALTTRRDPHRDNVFADCLIDPQARLTLFTSGSTGAPKPVHKTLAQLDAEVQSYAVQWGDRFDRAVFQASVPHHHIYGMTFFLLWPLAAGGVFDRMRCTGPGDWCHPAMPVQTRLRDGGADASDASDVSDASIATAVRRVIVSTPPQLARWPGLSGFDAPQERADAYAFLSAGAALSRETAHAYLRVFGAAPVEVYGSTETGAIATRQQRADASGDRWLPLPGQIVWRTEDGTLAVRSPHLRAGDDSALARDGFVTADAVTFGDANVDADAAGGSLASGTIPFLLGGRVDRIAKVSGKRVSLPEIEMALASHPMVDQAAAVTLIRSSDDTPRQRERIGILIVLRDVGSGVLFEQGRAAVIRILRLFLAAHVDPAAVPHYWRFLAALPFDQRGKLPALALRAAFAPTSAMPEVLSYAHAVAVDRPDAPRRWRYTMRIAASLIQFEGHFPMQPILPGVAQLHWAVQFAQRHVVALARMRSVEQLKFTAPIMPGATLTLTLTDDVARHRVAFVYEANGRSCATGLLCYEMEKRPEHAGIVTGDAGVSAQAQAADR